MTEILRRILIQEVRPLAPRGARRANWLVDVEKEQEGDLASMEPRD